MKQEFAFNRFSERRITLQKELLSLLENETKEKLLEKLKQNGVQEKLKIAFVGQHNSGKSTIISALTGNKSIKISANVETDIPADYVWNDVFLTDTPGLFAGVKEEHDTLSLKKIKESDLLVFCITSSLFDDLLIGDFVDLAYNQSYKSKIFFTCQQNVAGRWRIFGTCQQLYIHTFFYFEKGRRKLDRFSSRIC